MKLLLLGGSSHTRSALKRLLGRSGHQLEWHSSDSGVPDANLGGYDMVLVDGGGGECRETANLLELARQIQYRAPRLPIMVLSLLDGESAERGCGKRSGHSCGVSQSADGVWHMRCRLKELAWDEAAALLRDRLERDPEEPVTFEYQG